MSTSVKPEAAPRTTLMAALRAGPDRVRDLVGMLGWIGLRPGDVTVMLALTLGQALTEGIGVGLLYPLLAFIDSGPTAFAAGAPFPLPQVAGAIETVGLPLTLPILLAAVFAVFGLRESINFARASIVARIAFRRTSGLQARTAAAYIEADLPFHTSQNRGTIFTSIWNDCIQCSTLIQLTVEFLGLLFMGAIYCAILTVLSPELTVMILCGALLALPLFRTQMRRMRGIGIAILDAAKQFSIRNNETFQSIRLVKVRAQEVDAAVRLAEPCHDYADANWRRDRLTAALDSTMRPLFLATILLVFFVALTELNATLASLIAFVFTTTRLVPVFTRLGVLRGQIPTYLQGPQRVRDMIRRAHEHRRVLAGDRAFAGVGDGIRFENVSFHYAESAHCPAVEDVSFTLPAGETVGLVGPSGAGKSTLVDMLCRFYDPVAGRIVIDGHDLRDYDLASYRAKVSFVPQEPVMFDDTIRANLEYGLPEPLNADEIRSVLKRAHCLDFVEALPNGVDTLIGERAVRLSGGQRQRLALARALANEPSLLLLDEPTSALDSVSEQAIQETLDDLRGKVTILVVAHRLSTISRADRILVMQEGRIMAEGKHEALMGEGGVYTDLFRVQASLAS